MNKKGFTLIELAIVLIIVGVVTAGGIRMIYSALNSGKYTSSRNQLESIIKEIGEYSGRARRIPLNFAELSTLVSPSSDSFGNPVNYIPAPSLTTPVSGTYATGICSVSETSLTVRECSDSSCTDYTEYQNIAFFVSSSSSNGLKQIDDSANSILIYNSSLTIGGSEYDDITGWLTLNSLKQYAGCTGAPMEIIENKLPQAYPENIYEFTLHPKGGIGPFRWCIESSDPAVRENIYFKDTLIKQSGGCSGSVYETGDTLTISSKSSVPDIANTFRSGSVMRVYLQDSAGLEIFKDFFFRAARGYEMVLNGTDAGVPETEVTGFAGFNTANMDTGDSGQTGTSYNSDLINEVSPDKIEVSSSEDTWGSACIWYSGKAGLSFANRYIVSYFEFESNTSSQFEGFTYAVIKNIRPPSGSGSESESGYVSTEDDCGDAGSGMGYSYTDESAPDSNALYGQGFAVEFDPKESTEKNDPGGEDHMGIVSSSEGRAYNVHSSEDNDDCVPFSGSGGCYSSSGVYSGRRSVRVEAYHGCSEGGSQCNGASGNNNICVYVWISPEVAEDSEMRSTTTGYHLSGGIIPFGSPAIHDCYSIEPDSLDNVRAGFTFSNLGSGTVLDFYKYDFKSLAY